MAFFKFQRILPVLVLIFSICGEGLSQGLHELAPLNACIEASKKDCAPVFNKIIRQAEAGKSFGENFRFLMKASEELAGQGHFQLALQAIAEARRISADSLSLLAEVARRASAIFLFQGNLDSALALSQTALQLYLKTNDSVKVGIMYVLRGQLRKEKGDYVAAMADYVSGMNIFKTLNSPRHVARTQTEMATLAAVTGEVEKAIEYNKEAARYFESIGDEHTYGYVILNLANDLIYTGHEDTALGLLSRATAIFEKEKDINLWMNAEAQTGRAYHQLGEMRKAIEHLEQSVELGKDQNFIGQLAYNHEYLGRIYREMGNNSMALRHLRQSLTLHRQLGLNEEFRLSLEELALYYEAVGEADSALKYFREYMSVTDTLFSLESKKQLNELKTQYETELKEEQIKSGQAEIQLLEQKNQAQSSRTAALGLGLFLVLMTGAWIISRQRSKMRANRQLASEREKSYQAELGLKAAEEKRLQAALEHKKRELTGQALLIAEKNEMMRSFKEQLYEVSERLEESTMLNHVVQRMERAENQTQDWDKFMQIFEDVHPAFLQNIGHSFPNLSNNDLRLIVLMKMNFTNKEITSILHISEAGLKKARYRLRKKLDLASEENMHDYIRRL